MEIAKQTAQKATKYWNNIFFPNMQMTVIRKSFEQFPQTRKLEFRTSCDVGKLDIKGYMKSVYNVDVPKVNTLNVQGRVKRQGTKRAFRQKDWKKAIITVDPSDVQSLKR
ncbi:hypothetical protein DFA_01425 [Cavenderia fasciculata]|uniref:Large ribosomal subunit protein uL23m n=1 Tax=Cavenderia fasciculata TaxID=261658 RepID=F4PSR1_CACFS|nr:uncharacterized protein DFA_01425 [Cavenderia fasciculata]EGG21539.1 hypothetical protein DFA_01425 [Cavenderia fasciculata]|eukprot:XP_004359389.1 hypothetical protein DFA_01425 [Cavenderia fasciculata]